MHFEGKPQNLMTINFCAILYTIYPHNYDLLCMSNLVTANVLPIEVDIVRDIVCDTFLLSFKASHTTVGSSD